MQDILEETFCCPITSQLFIDPVVAQDGHTYQKATILSWLQKNNTSPLTREPIFLQSIRPNKAVKGIIQQFRKIEKNKIDIPAGDAFADKFSQQLDKLQIREDFKKYEKLQDQFNVQGFICPLSKLIYRNPVVAADGQTYEKRNIEQWMKSNQYSPITKSKLQNTMLYENRPIKRAIQFVKKDEKDRKQLSVKQRQLFNLFAPKIRIIIEQQLQKLDKNAANELLQNWNKVDKEIEIIGRQDLIKKQLQLDSFYMKDEALYFQMCSETSLFVGRKRQLSIVQELIKKNNIVCIVGAAGMGKSDLTRKYLNNCKAKSIIWLHAENKMINYQIIIYLEKVHKIVDIDKKDTLKLMSLFYSKLSKDALIVFDSVDNLASIQQYLPQNNIQKIFITSRFKGWQFPKVELNELEEKDYFLLLQNHLSKVQFAEEGKNQLELYKLLGGIPLALKQAISYLNSNPQITISEYVQQFKKTHLQEAEDKKIIDDLNPAYVSLIITLHRMRKENNLVDIILTTIGYISPSQLQKDFSMRFLESREKTPFTKNKSKKLKQTFRLLSEYSIISQDPKNDNIYRINELFQSAIRLIHKKNGSFKKCYSQLFSWTLQQLYYSEPSHADVQRVSKLIPHALALCKIQNTDEFKDKVDMWRQIGYHQLHSKHNYQFAKYCLLQAFKISRNNSLQQKSTYIDILNDLGCCCSGLNDHKKQQQYLTKALSISEKVFGQNHEKTAQVLTNLGEGYGHLGYFEKQRDVLQRALAIKMRILKQQGRNANISKCLTNLATAYGNLKDFKKKKQVLINALKISEQAYGPNNKDTMTVRMNLGNALRELGQKQRCLKELQIAEGYFISIFGPQHSLAVLATNNLTCAMMTFKCDMNKRRQKKQMNNINEMQLQHFMKQYGQIAMEMLSKNPELVEQNNNSNPSIPKQQNIKLLNQLGKQSHNAKKYEQALSYFVEALKLSEKKWGKDNENIGEILNNIGNSYNLMDKYDKSLPFLLKSVQINRKYKGNKHYLTAISLTNLGGAYFGIKQFVKYKEVSEEAASIFTKTHGVNHQWTQDALYNISHAKRYIQKYVK